MLNATRGWCAYVTLFAAVSINSNGPSLFNFGLDCGYADRALNKVRIHHRW